MAPYDGTQQWHHVHSPKVGRHLPPNHGTLEWHPAVAPLPLPQSWPSPSPIAHYNGTLQWHHVHSPKVGRHPPQRWLQWHRTMAPSNATTSTPPKLVVTFPLQPWHTTNAPCNGTTSTPPCNGTLVPRPICQNGSSPCPLLEVRTPIAIAIWGKKVVIQSQWPFHPLVNGGHRQPFLKGPRKLSIPKRGTIAELQGNCDTA